MLVGYYFVGLLATYQKLELEKKKSRVNRQVHLGPYIRYRSVTVPIVDEAAADTEINVDTDTVDRLVSFHNTLIDMHAVICAMDMTLLYVCK